MSNHLIFSSKFSTDIEAFEEVAKNENLSKTDLRVFMFLCCRVGSKHLARIDKSQIADTLNLSKKKVQEALDNLMSECIIAVDSDDHVKSGYKMTYTYNFDDD